MLITKIPYVCTSLAFFYYLNRKKETPTISCWGLDNSFEKILVFQRYS